MSIDYYSYLGGSLVIMAIPYIFETLMYANELCSPIVLDVFYKLNVNVENMLKINIS